MIIFGESALNDAVAVILFRFFSTLDTPSLSPSSFLLSILASGGVFLGSTLVGLLLALGYALATKHAKGGDAVTFQSVSFLAFAYASYLLAESLHLTGIISVFFCGLGMAHYGTDNVDEITLISSKVMLRTFSTLSEGVVFTYLGMGVVAWGGGMYDLRVAGVALVGWHEVDFVWRLGGTI